MFNNLGYDRADENDVVFANNGLHGAWLRGRIVKVTHQGAEPGAKCDVYDCFVD